MESKARRDFAFSSNTGNSSSLAARIARFKRERGVALKTAPHVCIGEIISPPTIRNQRTLIRLTTGGQKLYEVKDLEIWESIAS